MCCTKVVGRLAFATLLIRLAFPRRYNPAGRRRATDVSASAGLVAQSVEQRPFKPLVLGSSPSQPTTPAMPNSRQKPLIFNGFLHSSPFAVFCRQRYKTAFSPVDHPVLVTEISLRFSAVSHSDSGLPRVPRHSLPTFEKPALVRLRFI